MAFILILSPDKLGTVTTGNLRESNFHWRGNEFFRRGDVEQEPVFYDVLTGADGEVVALEVHVEPGDVVHAFLCGDGGTPAFPYIEQNGFPRIWIGSKRSGSPQGLEAFGDLAYYENDKGVRAIGFDLTPWEPVQNTGSSHR